MAESQTGTTPGVYNPILKDQTEKISPPPRIAFQIKELGGEYGGLSPFHIAQRLYSDPEFLDGVTKRLITNGSSEERRELYKQDPKIFEADMNKIRTNIQRQVAESYFVGQDIKSTVLRRATELTPNLEYKPSTETPIGTVAQKTGTQFADIGFVAGEMESNSDYAAISSGKDDPGGKSYGKYQLASKKGTLNSFLRDSQFGKEFDGLAPGSAEFDKKWKQLSGNQAFRRDQDRFISSTHFRPLETDYIKAGVDTSNVAIREAIFSASVNHSPGGNTRIRQKALEYAGDDLSPQNFLNSIYRARAEYVNGLSTLKPGTKQTLTNRYRQELEITMGLANQFDVPVPGPDKIREAVRKEPKRFPMFYDPITKQNIIPAGASGDAILTQTAKNNKRFRDTVNEGTMSEFESELSKHYNRQINANDAPELYSSAFAVWNGYGSEGLTKFINMIQFGSTQANIAEDKQDRRFVEANNWFKTTDINGVSPQKYVSQFVGGMVIDPPTKSKYAEFAFPKDFNLFTSFSYKRDDLTKTFIPRGDGVTIDRLFEQVYNKQTPTNSKTLDRVARGGISLDQIKTDVKAGFGEGYRLFIDDMTYMIRNGELPFGFQDLYDTIMANGKFEDSKDLGETYIVEDYDNSPATVKIALDAIKHDKTGEKFLVRGVSPEPGAPRPTIFAPKRIEAMGERDTWLGNLFRATTADKQEIIYDQNGNPIGTRTVADNDGIYGITNTVMAIPWALTGVVNTFVVEPILKATAAGARAMGAEQTAQQLENWDDLIDNIDVLQQDTRGFGEGFNAPNTVGTVTELVSLIAAAKFTGGATLAGVSRSFGMFNTVKKAIDIGTRVAPGMQNAGKFATMGKAFNKNNAKLWAGFMGVDAIGGDTYSLMNSGLLGQDAERYYRNQSQAMRTGLDVLSGLALGEILDWSLAAAVTGTRRGVLRRAAKDGDTFTKELVGRTQVGEMFRDLSFGLRDIELGSYKESLLRSFDNKVSGVAYKEPNTLADVTVGFVDNANLYMNNLRSDIGEALHKINNTTRSSWSKGGKFTDAEISTMADKYYRDTIDKMAENVVGFFEVGSRGIDDALWVRATSFLDEAATTPTIRSVTDQITGEQVKYKNIADAISETYTRDSRTGVAVLNGKTVQQLEDGSYGVFEIANNQWAGDLADAVRRKYLNKTTTKDEAADLLIKRSGGDPGNPTQYEAAKKEVDSFYGVRSYSPEYEDVVILGRNPSDPTEFLYRKSNGVTEFGELLSPRKLAQTAEEVPVRNIDGTDIVEPTPKLLPELAESIPVERRAVEYFENAERVITGRENPRISQSRAKRKEELAETPKGYSDSTLASLARRSGKSVDELAAATLPLTRNLGVDDIRVLQRGEGKGRVVAPESKGKIREWTPEKKVKKHVMVRHVDDDGYDAYYVSTKLTDAEPGTWRFHNDELIRDPDWTRVTENATFMRQGDNMVPLYYKRQDDGWYKLVEESDPDGVLLNIQKPVTLSAEDAVNGRFLDDVAVYMNNIDGYYTLRDGVPHFKPVRDIDQAMNPKYIDQADVYKADPEITIAKSAMVGPRAAGVIIGAMGGGFAGSLTGNEDVQIGTTMLGGLLGYLSGRGRYMKSMKNIKNITNPPKDADIPPEIENLVNSPVANQNVQTATLHGYAGDIRDPEEVRKFVDSVNMVKGGIGGGIGEGLDAWFKNEFVESSFGFLSRLSPAAKELRDILFRLYDNSIKYRAMPKLYFEEKYGIGAFDKALIEGNEEVLSIVRNDPDLFRYYSDVVGKEVDARDAKDIYDEYMAMMLHTNGKITDSVQQEVQGFYTKNPHLAKIHTALSQNERAVDMFDSYRRMLNDVQRDYKEALVGAIGKNKRLLVGPHTDRMNEWLDIVTGQNPVSFDAFLDNLKKVSPSEYRMLKQASESGYTKLLMDMGESYRTFQNFEEGYFTQLLDTTKIEKLRNDYYARNADLSDMDKEVGFKKEMLNTFMEYNTGVTKNPKNASRYLFKYDEATSDIVMREFDSLQQAREKVGAMIHERNFDDDTSLRLINNITTDAFEKNVNGKWRINIDHPSFMGDDMRSVFENYEYNHLESMFNTYLTGAASRQSNFLDRRRKFVVPFEWRLTDMDRWQYRYTQDTGPRITMLKNGITDTKSLKENYINKIGREINPKVANADVRKKYLDRVESIFNMQMGMIKSVMEADSKAGRQAALNTWVKNERLTSIGRNIAFGAYAPGIAWLDSIQPLVFGSIISSSRNIRAGYGLLHNDKEAFNNLIKVSEHFGIANKSLEMIRPDLVTADEALLSGSSRIDKAYAMSRRISDYGASFSMVGTGMKALTGQTWDPSNLGLRRLALGDFYTVNAASSTINWYAAVNEALDLSAAWRDLGDGNSAVVGKREMTRRDIVNKFSQIGIGESRIEGFVESSARFKEMLDGMKEGKLLDRDTAQNFPSLYDDFNAILNHSTDAYHGRNKMSRPESWSSPMGKLLSQFAVYPFNFAAQINKVRVIRPIQDWMEKYHDGVSSEATPLKILYAMGTGNMNKLREWKFSDEAIKDLPLDAWHSTIKGLLSVGLASATLAGRDAFFDTLNAGVMASAEATGIPQELGYQINEDRYFSRTKRNLALEDGPGGPKRLLWEAEANPNDMGAIFMWAVNQFVRAGALGKAGDFLNPFVEQGGVSALGGPMIGFANDLAKGFAKTINAPFMDIPGTAVQQSLQIGSRLIPALPAYGLQNYFRNSMWEQYKIKGDFGFDTSPANVFDSPSALGPLGWEDSLR